MRKAVATILPAGLHAVRSGRVLLALRRSGRGVLLWSPPSLLNKKGRESERFDLLPNADGQAWRLA